MNKYILSLTAAFFFLSLGALHYLKNDDSQLIKKISKYDRIAMMTEMEIEMTKDPQTGEVPRHTLTRIRKEVAKQQAANARNDISWNPRGPDNVGGRTRALLVDRRDPTNGTLFTGSVSGGLWKCTNATSQPVWERIENYEGSPSISAIVQDPNNAEIMYLGTGEGWYNGDAYRGNGIYKSTDGGESWQALPSTMDDPAFYYTQKLIFDGNGVLYACTRNEGIVKTTNGGDTWLPVLSNFAGGGFSNRATDLEIASNGTMYACMGIFTVDGIYRSTDGGIEWEYLDFGVEDFERSEIAVSASNPNVAVALLQGDDSRSCDYILRTEDGGDTWSELTVPSAAGMDNFTRGQAWYDLAVAIDPNNSDVMWIGGVDLLKTTNGGVTWQQQTNWFGGGFPYVHADQHLIQYIGNTSNEMYFTNDGGIWYTNTATSFDHNIRAVTDGYITTQFYSCAIHPEAGVDYFVAGAQDNGTNRLTSEGVGGAFEVMGGDGAYCHIDQLDPNYQVAASQSGNYRFTKNGWTTSESFRPDGRAYFINPTTYDSETKTLYASHSEGKFLWFDLESEFHDSVQISQLNGSRVSSLKVSPHNSDILYLGTNFGSVIKVENPKSANPITETLFVGDGFARNIDVDRSNPNRLLVTYSNYSVQSIYVSEDGGDSWTTKEGDLPNIPIRWGVFNPSNPAEVLLASEVGVWRGHVTAPSMDWESINESIGTCRVNMLEYRESDFEMLAATYGKGLYTTSDFGKQAISFQQQFVALDLEGEFSEDFCDGIYSEVFTIKTTKPYEEDKVVGISIADESTAVEGQDFQLSTTEVTLPAGELSVDFVVDFFDDSAISEEKTLSLDLTTTEEVIVNKMNILIKENDFDAQQGGADGESYTFGSEGDFINNVFRGLWENARTQVLYKRDQLTGIGLEGGQISSLTFNVFSKQSLLTYDNFRVRISHTTKNDLEDGIEAMDGSLTVFEGSIDTKVGEVKIPFNNYFNYNGEDNLLIEFCFDNADYTDDDVILGTPVDYQSLVSLHQDGIDGCLSDGLMEDKNVLPNITFTTASPTFVFDELDYEFSSTLREDPLFFRKHDSVFLSVVTDVLVDDCISASLYSNSEVQLEDGQFQWIDRVYAIQSESDDTPYRVSLYINEEEADEWIADGNSVILYSELPPDMTGNSWQLINIDNTFTFDNKMALDFMFNKSGYYALGNMSVSTEDPTQEIEYDNVVFFDLMGRRVEMEQELLPTGIYIKTYMKNDRVVHSKKVFRQR